MVRIVKIASAVCLLLLMSGCAGYQAVMQPWDNTPDITDFDSPTVLHVGDRIRVLTADLRTIEGTLTNIQAEAMVVSRSDGKPPVEIIPHHSVKSLEVYQNGSDRLTLVMAASVFVYVIAKALTPDTVFSPDHDAR